MNLQRLLSLGIRKHIIVVQNIKLLISRLELSNTPNQNANLHEFWRDTQVK